MYSIRHKSTISNEEILAYGQKWLDFDPLVPTDKLLNALLGWARGYSGLYE